MPCHVALCLPCPQRERTQSSAVCDIVQRTVTFVSHRRGMREYIMFYSCQQQPAAAVQELGFAQCQMQHVDGITNKAVQSPCAEPPACVCLPHCV